MQRTTYFKTDNKTVIPEDKNKPIQIEIFDYVDISTILKTFPWEEKLTVKKDNANRPPFNERNFYSIMELTQNPVETGGKKSFRVTFVYKKEEEAYQKVCFLDSEERINLFLKTLKEIINPLAFQRIEDIMMGRNVERSDKIKTFYTKDGDLMIVFYEEEDAHFIFTSFYWDFNIKAKEDVVKYLEKEREEGRKVAGIMIIPTMGPIDNIFFLVTEYGDKRGYHLPDTEKNRKKFPNIIKHFIPPKYMKSVVMKFEFA